jgi:hypothetical protein
MVTIEGDLIIQGGRILGRLERWDIPVVRGRRCHKCDQLIPVPNWEYHQHACHTNGWARFQDPLSHVSAVVVKRRPKVDFAAELAGLLK